MPQNFGLGVTLATIPLKSVAIVYDFLTILVYAAIDQPWKTLNMAKTTQAYKIRSYADSVTYRSARMPSLLHAELVNGKINTMAKMLDYCAKKHPNNRCLGTRKVISEKEEVQPDGQILQKFKLGKYEWKTMAEVNKLAGHFGKGLREFGNNPKVNIGIFAETRAEWMIAAHGIFKQNIPLVTIYATLGNDAIVHGLNETEVSTVITTHNLMPKFKTILPRLPNVKTLIYFEDQLNVLDNTGYKEGVEIIKFSDVLNKGSLSNMDESRPEGTDVAIIMYTSGSTGVPKGVVLLHKNILASLRGFVDCIDISEGDVMIGFLPLAHVYELLIESVCFLFGIGIGYSTPLTLLDSSPKIMKGSKGDASVLKPTIMTSVPLILDRISKTLRDRVEKASIVKKVLFKFAYDYKVMWTKWAFRTPLMNRIVFGPMRKIMGGRLKYIFSGGAPLTPITHNDIEICLCVKLLQGYGLTETTSAATVQQVYDTKHGRVGAPLAICDIQLVNWDEGNYRVTDKPYPRGEVLIGGVNVAQGYYKLQDLTEQDFFDYKCKRWFKTGDIGEMQDDGCLKLIDRKKDLVKLSGGEFVSLGKVEARLKTHGLIENICVYAEAPRTFTIAILVPNEQKLKELALKFNLISSLDEKKYSDLCDMEALQTIILAILNEHAVSNDLQKFEIPKAVRMVPDEWTPDSGLVTAAFKLKRVAIKAKYIDKIYEMYPQHENAS